MLYKFRWFTSSVVGIVMVCLDQWEKHQLCRYFLEHELQMACWGFPDWRGSWQTWEFIDTSQRWWMVVPDVLHCVCFFLDVCATADWILDECDESFKDLLHILHQDRKILAYTPTKDPGPGPWHDEIIVTMGPMAFKQVLKPLYKARGCFCYIKTRSFPAVSHRFLSSLYWSVE